jgi:hypothetical protein
LRFHFRLELQDMKTIVVIFRIIEVTVLAVFLLGSSSLPPADDLENVRRYTRTIEFDYIQWTLDALLVKNDEAALSMPDYLDESLQNRFVLESMKLVDQIDRTNQDIEKIYTNPATVQPDVTAAPLLKKLADEKSVLKRAAPVSEAILQGQISQILKQFGLTVAGQPIPPVLYHVTPLPLALIVSPRDKIQQDANISLAADFNLPQMTALEEQVSKGTDKSALVVEIGGVGVYPTMVMNTSDLPYLVETVAHEWTHNYLTLRPLGLNYETSPELRTMNETTASLVGSEVGLAVLKAFYPDKVPPPANDEKDNGSSPPPSESGAKVFNFRSEMHKTRVTVDEMLAAGKIDEAEKYMEARRVFFWDHGYQIRKLNQAYFAFYGAYADTPGGAAGADPVGPAVRALRSQSPSLADFLNRISWMTSFEDLKKAVNSPSSSG